MLPQADASLVLVEIAQGFDQAVNWQTVPESWISGSKGMIASCGATIVVSSNKLVTLI